MTVDESSLRGGEANEAIHWFRLDCFADARNDNGT